MPVSTLLRVGGAVLLLAGLMSVAGWLLTPIEADLTAEVNNPLFGPSYLMVALGSLLLVITLPAAYSRVARTGGWTGLVGFGALMAALAMLGFFLGLVQLMILPWVVSQPLTPEALAEGPPAFGTFYIVASLMSLLGAVLFGLAVVRARTLSRRPGYLLIVAGVAGLVLNFAPLPDELGFVFVVAPVLSSLALAWLGYEVWRSAERAEIRAEQPTLIERGRDEAA